DIAARTVLPAAKMNSIPTASDLHATDVDVAGELEHDCIVGCILDRDIPDRDVLAIPQQQRMRPAHPLLSTRIKYLIPIDDSLSRNGHILDPFAQDQRPMPAQPSRQRSLARRREIL